MNKATSDQINVGQLMVITAQIVFATGFLSVGHISVSESETGAWLGTLLGSIGGLAVAVLCGAVAARHPGKNLSMISQSLFPPVVAKFVSLTFAAYCTWVMGLGSRQFLLAIWIPYLRTTPPLVITVVFVTVTMYGASLGIEAISRASMLFFPVVLLSIIALAGLALPVAVPGRLLPLQGTGLLGLAKTALLTSSYGAECVIALALVRQLNQPERAGKAIAVGVAIGTLVIAIVVAVGIMMLGTRGVARTMFPVLETAKLVGVGEFLERSEILMLALWFSAALLKQAAVFYASVTSMADVFGLRNYQPLVIPFAVLAVVFGMLPRTVVEVWAVLRAFLKYSFWYALAVPAILLLASAIRARGGDRK